MDIFGKALLDHHHGILSSKLWLHNNYSHAEEMPIDIFFRDKSEMPELELLALDICRGKILDIGAGVGSHTLALQNRGADVTAVEISATACNIMEDRGILKVINADIFDFSNKKFDTLLLLMNGIGLTETLTGFRKFLNHAKTLLNPTGQLVFDSSDISYLYDDISMPADKYHGEISYQYEYDGQFGDWFNWLYIDSDLLVKMASGEGWDTEVLYDDGMDQFLVRLKTVN